MCHHLQWGPLFFHSSYPISFSPYPSLFLSKSAGDLYDNAWLLHCQPPQTFCFLGPRGDLHHRLSCFGRNGSCEGQRNWMKEIIMLLLVVNKLSGRDRRQRAHWRVSQSSCLTRPENLALWISQGLSKPSQQSHGAE